MRIGSDALAVSGEDEIRELAEAGKLRPENYVFDPAQQRWMYARELPFLDAAFGSQAVKANPSSWIVQVGGRNHPLADIGAARGWISSGRITRATLVRNPILERWMRAGDVLELTDAFDTAPPPAAATATQRRRSADALILGGIVLAVAAVVLALAMYARDDSAPAATQRRVVTATATATTTATSAPATPPKIYDYTLGVKTDKVTVQPAPATTPVAEAAAPAAPAAPTTTAPPAETVAETTAAPAPRPARRPLPRDDAEEDEYDDGGDIVFKSTDAVRAQVSGDTRVYIDRTMRDSRYHVSACTYVSGEMSSVSLDLARQNYTPCPVCKPPQ